jgi:streptogramin lyase
MRNHQHPNAVVVCLLLTVTGCSSTPGGSDESSAEDVGTATAAITAAPNDVGCVVVKVVGTTTVTKRFTVVPGASTSFSLDGLPLGNDVFSAAAYTRTCALIGTSAPTWIDASSVTADVTRGSPVAVTLQLVPNTDSGSSRVGVNFSPPSEGVVTEYPIPNAAKVDLYGIASGPDGNLWVTEALSNQIARVTPSGAVTLLPALSDSSWITASPDGNMWFVGGSGLGVITPSGEVTSFSTPTANAGVGDVAWGPDDSLWFTEPAANQIGRCTVRGEITEFPVPTAGSAPLWIASGPDGNLWFIENNSSKVGRVTVDGKFAEFPVPNGVGVSIAAGPDGNVWFSEIEHVARITTA